MITFLRGVVIEISDPALTLDVNGVGYEVICHGRLLNTLAVGEETTIHTYHLVRETEEALYGMADAAERQAFMILLKVSGVGAKVALAVLSVLSPNQLADAVTLQDAAAVSQAPGVGKKLAERIVLELKGKFAVLPGSSAATAGTQAAGGNVQQDVISALMNLGYKPQIAQTTVVKVSKQAEEPLAFDALFKASLQELRP